MHLKVTDDFGLIPISDDGIKYVYNRTPGDILKCEVILERNYKFHQKAISLVILMHDVLPEPEPVMFKGELIQPTRTFDDTREYLTILSGEYDVIGLPNGKVRLKARSWKFSKMSADEFDVFYSNLIDASIKALPDTWSEDDKNKIATQIIGFV